MVWYHTILLSENLHAVVTVIHPQKIRRDEPMILLCESLWVAVGRCGSCTGPGRGNASGKAVSYGKGSDQYTLFSVSKLEMELT